MPLFSIITTVYNNEKYIRSAAESILQQGFRDLEYIIVDDGSTDATAEITDQIAKEDSRVHVIHQKNQWVYASLNNGIKEANGDYIFIVNSDDRLRSDILKIVADKINIYKRPDVIWTKVLTHHCDLQQNIICYDYYNIDKRFIKDYYFDNEESVRDNWMLFYDSGLAHNQINFYKREIMNNHPFRNDFFIADRFFNISIAPAIHSALILKEAAYDYYLYNSENMNASYGKYGYEHEMFDVFLNQFTELFIKWGRYNNEIKDNLYRKRIKYLSSEIRALNSKKCTLSLEEKLNTIFFVLLDEHIVECVKETGTQEEFESRVLSGIRTLFINDMLPEDSEMFFVYELLESLLRYEKDEEDFLKIKLIIH